MLIYILSRGPKLYSTLRIYKAAVAKGHTVRIIDHMECDLLIEKGQCKIVYNEEILPKPDFIIPRIGSSVTFYGSTVVRHFEQMGVQTLNDSIAILNSRDKFRSLQFLAANDIQIPTTYFSNDLFYAKKIVQSKLGYPFIIKVLEGTQGLGVYKVKDEAAATETLSHFMEKKSKIILQEYIEEFSGKDLRVFVVGSKIVATMMRIAGGDDFRSNLHRGGRGEKVELTPGEKEMAIKSVKALNLQVAGVDILRSKKGPMVIEVNSSPGLEGIERVSEIKIAEEIIDLLERLKK
ncbi:MAG: RimK family alpha-L-glutamate ligase [Crocinitomicaceae bacterium]|nr:RimK family alpha-L-glutamate ligase [Crocinitomicaceae bacterium]MBK8927099.1 RimK family alpha-L-glutamate ligase [Crocinitomicaceae bacterium]